MPRVPMGTVVGRLFRLRRLVNPAARLEASRKEASAPGPEEDESAPGEWSTLQMGAAMAVIALAARLIMMYDESREPERIAKRARKFAEDQENMKPLSKEQWAQLQSVHPLTPFEGSIDTSRARVRTGSWPGWSGVSDWAKDSLSEALERNEKL